MVAAKRLVTMDWTCNLIGSGCPTQVWHKRKSPVFGETSKPLNWDPKPDSLLETLEGTHFADLRHGLHAAGCRHDAGAHRTRHHVAFGTPRTRLRRLKPQVVRLVLYLQSRSAKTMLVSIVHRFFIDMSSHHAQLSKPITHDAESLVFQQFTKSDDSPLNTGLKWRVLKAS